ncbi:hypothetical protein JQU17_20145 [Ponticoccus sp. SC2-23]|uniref:hypothetical protein n=1 Tax=Alexandriicola marinus TaxID=2081710 RepID=UPI000FDB9BCC|nr:hypothetical protein [Alexandriicola marinus]MBM1222527.1 hypothetical protein [Ponticoccus sp. SC6-9]MBM1227033.1 hypothetical protein [Ponticoccus sp. SC6-15]MBM1231454.1 hypothetical protein [Ponticoccus sp. SC6-38]MBM1236110.1 hypothetical protein [Ponticoccus sp. SC6-45]MBM1240477.1 hypothetical protein [Ponticoccus sp. SC6-49]MBM1245012.1 hypothetical protein [Ponticoccus sp. SC2-64]MBM1249585.1 hypothetical protein [Ponticoccus sp. SC6-42]MBM1253970.1 hypothetical protein [Pontico
MKVFFDTNIFSASRSYEKIISTKKIHWGDIEFKNEEQSYQRKIAENPEHQALLYIGAYGRSGAFSAHITRSIKLEMLPQSRFARDTEADALRGIGVQTHPDIIELSCFRSFTLIDDLMKIKPAMTEAIGIIKDMNDSDISVAFSMINAGCTYEDFLNRIGAVKKIAAIFDRKHWPDAFHYVSAEHNGADFFLTCDQKFLNFVRNTAEYKSPCIALSPTQLLQNLNIATH